MGSKGPSQAQIEAAENYALGQMCVSVPAKYGNYGYTKWNSKTQQCLVTEQGCQPGPTNMISQWPLDGAGNVINFADQPKSRYHDVWKYAPADLFVMKATRQSGGRPVCSRGNALVYQWCDFPKTRGQGAEVPGLTNVVPFKYGVQNGKETCLIPKDYCATHAYDWDQKTLQCYEPPGLQAAEFFGVKDLAQQLAVNGISALGNPGAIALLVGFAGGGMLGAAFSVGTAAAIEASDSRLKENIRVHTRDFVAPGIHLYTFRWKPWALEIYGKHGNDMGFIADTLPREWVVVDGHGYRNINLDVKHPGMKKIRDFLSSRKVNA